MRRALYGLTLALLALTMRTGAAADQTRTGNQVVNPGFEAPDMAGWSIRDWAVDKGTVSLQRHAAEARSGATAARARFTNAENVVVAPTLARMPVGKQKLRLTVWYKLLAPGSVYASVVTNAYDGTQLQYLSSPRQTTVSRWAELTYDFVTDPRTRSMSLYLRPTVDGILFDDASLVALDAPVAAAFAPVDRSLKWTAETVEAELKRYEPALKGFGIKDPLRWARARIAAERDWVGRQGWWERRIAHWRFMFLGDEPVDWARWLDLDHPALAGRKAQLAAGGATARQAWAEHVREEKPNLRPLLNDRATRIILFEASDPKVYPPDGSFSPERAEALLEGKVTGLHQVPEEGEGDYGWIQTCNPAGWHLRYLGLAYYHDRDPKWVREFQNEIIAMVLGHNYQPNGYTAVATRLRFAIRTYLLMKDSPAMSDQFHALIGRWLWAHARQTHSVGATGYETNFQCVTGDAMWWSFTLFPEFRGSQAWRERMWPLFLASSKRELLEDGLQHHRAYNYHMAFVSRGLAILAMARWLGVEERVPDAFLPMVEGGVEAFLRTCTPIRSTPGVNDDPFVTIDLTHFLELGADLFGRDDWRYVATEGGEGTRPPFRSALLPDSQLVTMRSDWSREANWLFFKVSPEAGHHHRDTLGIQIWSRGRRLLIEPDLGYYTLERKVYNQSWWHSTPTLGKSLLPIRGDNPEVLHWEAGDTLDYAVGQITVPLGDGQPPARFRRHVFFGDHAWWVVWDEFAGVPGGRVVWENFHFPTRTLEMDKGGRVVKTMFESGANLLMAVGVPGWTLAKEQTRSWDTHPYSGETTPTMTLHYQADGELASQGFAALLVPFAGRSAPAARFEQIEQREGGQVKLHVTVGGTKHTFTTWREK